MSDFSKFHFETETLKKTLDKNASSTKFVDKCIVKFANNIFVQKPVVITVPYLGNISSIPKKGRLKFCKLKVFQVGVTDSKIILDVNIVFPKPYN